MRPTLVFDVLETLLDLRDLDEPFAQAFGDARVREEWFSTLLHQAFTATITGRFEPFDALAAAALRTVAARRGVAPDEPSRSRILRGLLRLSPHPDVLPALERLRTAGFPLYALTNGTHAGAETQLRHAGLRPFFADIHAADRSEAYKPKAQVYRNALARIGVTPHDAVLVSAHAWDIAGARTLGIRTAFVARPGCAIDPAGPQPNIIARDLGGVADKLLFFPLTSLAG